MSVSFNLSALCVIVIVYFVHSTHTQSLNNSSSEIVASAIETTDNNEYRSMLKVIDDETGEEITYDGFLSRNPRRIEIKSPNYPNNYAAPYLLNLSIVAENGTGVDVIIHDLDLNPNTDYLYIRSGIDGTEKGILYTGRPTNLPFHMRMLSTNSFTMRFEATGSTSNSGYRGFLLTYEPFGQIPVVTEPTTTPFPVGDQPLEFFMVHLAIAEDRRNNETWEILRISLSDMANDYIIAQNISAAECLPDYVVFQAIKNCPSTWRNAENCVSVEFAIAVPIIEIDEDDEENQYKLNTTNFKYELTASNIQNMWGTYAVRRLELDGIAIFEQENSLTLLMWIGVSLLIITAFLIVLYCIWRMDELNAYRRFHNKRGSLTPENDQKPSVMDDQLNYYQDLPPSFPDPDAYDDMTSPYITSNNLFTIGDDDPYTKQRPSVILFDSFAPPPPKVFDANAVPKSALKSSSKFKPFDYQETYDDSGRITINTTTIQPRQKQQLFLPDPSLDESNS